MRTCAAGTVRPLGSNEPLLASAAAGDSPAKGQGVSAEAALMRQRVQVARARPVKSGPIAAGHGESGKLERRQQMQRCRRLLMCRSGPHAGTPCCEEDRLICCHEVLLHFADIERRLWILCMRECWPAISVAWRMLSMSLRQCRLTMRALARMVTAASCKDGQLQESRPA